MPEFVPLYDTMGRTYSATRRADPRVGAQISQALAGSASVVNIGAGTGSYEPAQTIAAIEPSQTMIDQRPPGAAPAIRATAEHLPLRDNCADAALAVLTVHHWTDLAAGIAEMRRIARNKLVVLTWDAEVIGERFWLLSEYLPEARAADAALAVPMDRLVALLGDPVVTPVPVPHDCADGFAAAYWRRPDAYLDPAVRAGMSLFTKSGEGVVEAGLARLAADLRSGRWHDRHAELLELAELDLGYRLITSGPTDMLREPITASRAAKSLHSRRSKSRSPPQTSARRTPPNPRRDQRQPADALGWPNSGRMVRTGRPHLAAVAGRVPSYFAVWFGSCRGPGTASTRFAAAGQAEVPSGAPASGASPRNQGTLCSRHQRQDEAPNSNPETLHDAPQDQLAVPERASNFKRLALLPGSGPPPRPRGGLPADSYLGTNHLSVKIASAQLIVLFSIQNCPRSAPGLGKVTG